MNTLIKFICTVFYVGLIPFAPGTFASIAGVIMAYFLNFDTFVMFVTSCIIFLVGYVFSDIYAHKKMDGDPKEIVIDEIIGIFITLIICFSFVHWVANYDRTVLGKLLYHKTHIMNFIVCVFGFILFRFFDIKKPNIIGYIDKNVKGGIGIMMDDVVAGIFAGITFILISPFFLLLYKIFLLS